MVPVSFITIIIFIKFVRLVQYEAFLECQYLHIIPMDVNVSASEQCKNGSS